MLCFIVLTGVSKAYDHFTERNSLKNFCRRRISDFCSAVFDSSSKTECMVVWRE